MKISDRDKKLICFALAIIMVACAYFFGYKKISALNSELDTEISKNRTLYNNLKDMASREAQYKEDTEYYTSEYNNLLTRFDTGYSQEYSIVFVDKMETATSTWISQLGLGNTAQIYGFGNIASSNPINQGSSVYSSDYVGYDTTLNLAYECSYDDMKTLIDYINSYEFKCKISSMSFTYNKDKDKVTGSIVLNLYAITGSDRKFFGAPISNKLHGTENIFDSQIFEPDIDQNKENGNSILTDYDYYIALDSFKSDADGIVIGPRGDSAVTRLSMNSSERENVTITFAGKNGEYTVSYRIGDITYPAVNYEAGVAFNPGSMLSLLVFSADRSRDGDDVNGADATIINKTDMKLYIKIVDDKENPRFRIKEKSGSIEVYE